MDASNLLKPALARGELHCIGATTLDEYRKYIEKDAALERRFQPVLVKEPNVEDTIAILRGLKERYEKHHGIKIRDAALDAAATLSDRYITDRFLPDKAIDLVDEAASRVSMELALACRPRSTKSSGGSRGWRSQPASSPKRTTARRAKERDEIQAEIAEHEAEARQRSRSNGKPEKLGLGDVKDVREELEQVDLEYGQLEAAMRDKQSVRPARRRAGLPAAVRTRHTPQAAPQDRCPAGSRRRDDRPTKSEQQHRLLRTEVGPEEIAQVVSAWTGIPVTPDAADRAREAAAAWRTGSISG